MPFGGRGLGGHKVVETEWRKLSPMPFGGRGLGGKAYAVELVENLESPMPFGGRGLGGAEIVRSLRPWHVTNAFRREGVGRGAPATREQPSPSLSRHQCLSAGGGWAGALRLPQRRRRLSGSPMPFGGRGLGGGKARFLSPLGAQTSPMPFGGRGLGGGENWIEVQARALSPMPFGGRGLGGCCAVVARCLGLHGMSPMPFGGRGLGGSTNLGSARHTVRSPMPFGGRGLGGSQIPSALCAEGCGLNRSGAGSARRVECGKCPQGTRKFWRSVFQ